MGANLSAAQINVESEVIEKHNEKLTCLLMILYDGKYVLYFDNT